MKHHLCAFGLAASLVAAVPAAAQQAADPGPNAKQTAATPPAAVDYLFPDLGPNALVWDGKYFYFRPIFAWVVDYTSLSQDDASVTQVGTQDDTGELRAGRLGFTLRSKGRLGLEFYTTSTTRNDGRVRMWPLPCRTSSSASRSARSRSPLANRRRRSPMSS